MMNYSIGDYKLESGILVVGSAVLLMAVLHLWIVKPFFRKPRLTMSPATEDSISAISSAAEDLMLDGLRYIQQALERLYESEDAQLSQEELRNDVGKIAGVAARIRQTKNYSEKSNIYSSEYLPLSIKLKSKYREFLPDESFAEIETTEKRIDLFKELIVAYGLMHLALSEEISQEDQAKMLYTGMINLSECVEENVSDFPPSVRESVAMMAQGIVDDAGLKPDKKSQSKSLYTYLIGLRNAARDVLWQLEEYKKNLPKHSHFLDPQDMMERQKKGIEWIRRQIAEDEAMGPERREIARQEFETFRQIIDPTNILYPRDWPRK